MGKIALHGPKEVLIRLDRGIACHDLGRRHSFVRKGFRFPLRLFPFMGSGKLFQWHVICLFSYDSFFDELINGQGNRFFVRHIAEVFMGSFTNSRFFLKAICLSFFLLSQALPLPIAANPFIGLLPSPLISMKALQLIPDKDPDHTRFVAFDEVDLLEGT